MGCLSGLIKIIVIVLNFLCVLLGLVLIIVGTIYYCGIDKYYDLTKLNYNVATSIVIALGVIIFLISCLGFCGVLTGSAWMLFTYAGILIVLFIIQIGVGTFGHLQVNKSGAALEKQLHDAMKKTFTQYRNQTGVQRLFDITQLNLECCGVDAPSDYEDKIPASCCGEIDFRKSCTSPTYTEGCSKKLLAFIVKVVKIVSNVSFGLAAVELVAAMSAIYLGIIYAH